MNSNPPNTKEEKNVRVNGGPPTETGETEGSTDVQEASQNHIRPFD